LTALVVMAAASVPQQGSLRAKAPMAPLASFVRYLSFISGEA